MTHTSYLSAIFFADIEGYTALMQKDEQKTLLLLDNYQQTLTRMVGKYDGEIVKNLGDGSICLFTSAVRSVECAIELQQELRLPPEVPLRIGLNLGDVHRKDDDVFGDAINVTSRIESMGKAGNILMSHSMYQKVKNHPEFKFQSIGKFDFKNVNETLEVFAIANEGFVIPKRKELVGKFKTKQSKIRKFVPAGIFAAMAIYFFAARFWQQDDSSETQVQNKIAVFFDDNIIKDSIYNMAGKMASDWIIHGITQNKLGQVISPENIEDYVEYSDIIEAGIVPSTKKKAVLTKYLKPSKIIKGEYYLNKNRLLFQCSITDGSMERTLHSFEPVECDSNAPLDCIEALKQRILGYLVTEDKKIINLEENPPNFQAYKIFNEKAKIKYLDDPYDPESLKLFEQAINADSTYFEPQIYKFLYYYNLEQYAIADSLLQRLLAKSGTHYRQQILLNEYEALLDGNLKRAHEYQKKEYNISPLHLETNSNMMIQSLQLVNKPKEIDSVYGEINMDGWDIPGCHFCQERLKIKAMSDIELGKYNEAIALLKDYGKEKDFVVLKKILLRAYIRSGDNSSADDILPNISLEESSNSWLEVYLFAAKEFIWMGNKKLANIYLDKIIKAVNEIEGPLDVRLSKIRAESLFFREDYEASEEVLEKLLSSSPELIYFNSLLAIVYQKSGKISQANSRLKVLENLRKDYQYGNLDYALAQYYASVSDEEKTINFLNKAIAEGHWFETGSFQNDPLLKAYFETEFFQQILTLRH